MLKIALNTMLILTLPVLVSAVASLAVTSLSDRWTQSAHVDQTLGSKQYVRGRDLFQLHCSGCHSVDGSGQRRLGPPLDDIGRVGAERKPGMTSVEYILESIVDPGAYRAVGTTGGMPDGIVTAPEDIREIVGFLAGCGATVRSKEIEGLSIPEYVKKPNSDAYLDFDQVMLGESIFYDKGQCIVCHPLRFGPDFTLKGPSLQSIGSVSESDLRRAIEEPRPRSESAYCQVVAHKKDGRSVEGRLVGKTKSGVYLLRVTASGGCESIFVPYSEMDTIGDKGSGEYDFGEVSSMPSYKDFLSRRELDALVAFLRNRHGSQDK
jgi:mono/diheme cytochrome c family protein